jgi:2',3'-cyclic-nucleotide 2'-phosphodiesterase (5'-nucleotidase family)
MKNLEKLKVIILSLLLLAGCSEDKKVNLQQYSMPTIAKDFSDSNNIVLLTTSDFNGSIYGKTYDRYKQAPIGIGGAGLLANYLEIFTKKFRDNGIVLDTGFFISEKEQKKSRSLREFLSYDAVALTENEIKFFNEDSKISAPFTNLNILDIKEMKSITHLNNQPYIIKEVKDTKVAIVSITLFTPTVASSEDAAGLLFDDPVARLISNKSEIKKNSDIVILMVHDQSICIEDDKECHESEDRIEKVAKRLPPDFIDIIIGNGEYHSLTEINDMSVLMAPKSTDFISLSIINPKLKRVIKNKPIKLCSQFFEYSSDCHVDTDDIDKSIDIRQSVYRLKSASFLGDAVVPNRDIEVFLNAN